MEVRVICDCRECSSRLVELGGVNILCNMPTRLLRDCARELEDSKCCDAENRWNEALYSKLLCLEIHVILATTPRGLDGIDTLRRFYDVGSAHIVCTRPVYTLVNLTLPKRTGDAPVAAIATSCTRRRPARKARAPGATSTPSNARDHHVDLSECILSDVRHPPETSGSQPDPLGSGISDSADMDIDDSDAGGANVGAAPAPDDTTAAPPPGAAVTPAGKADDAESALSWVRSRSSYLKSKMFYSEAQGPERFGPAPAEGARRPGGAEGEQPFLKNPALTFSENLHAVSYNEMVTLDITGVGQLQPQGGPRNKPTELDALLGKSVVAFSATIELCAFCSGVGLGSSNWVLTHTDSKTSVALIGETGEPEHGRFCPPVDLSFVPKADLVVLLDNAASRFSPSEVKLETRVKRELVKPESEAVKGQLDALCDLAIQGLQNPEGVVVVADPYGETVLDVLEHLHFYMRRHLKQHQHAFMYAFGRGMADVLHYADKCAEWVEASRAERTMHHENPSSPFTAIAEMRESNQLFIGNGPGDISGVYRFPSVVVVSYDPSTVPYIHGRVYAGADVVTTSEAYRDELMAAGASLGVKPRVTAVALDFRAQMHQLLQMIGAKAQIIVSAKMGEELPRSLKVHAGDTVSLPAATVSGLLRVDVKAAALKRALAAAKPVGGGADAVAIDVQLHHGETLDILPSSVAAEDAKLTFGTFTADELVRKLGELGAGRFTMRGSAAGGATAGGAASDGAAVYPVELVGEDDSVIVLESAYETCVEAAAPEARERIVHVLEQLLTAL